MPTYIYQCKICDRTLEVDHSMAECDNPSEETIHQTTCPKDHYECKPILHELSETTIFSEDDFKFVRIPQMPEIKGSYGGSSLSGKEKLSTIQGERKERSHKDFKKNIFPTLPKQEQKWFKNKKNGREY